MMIRAYLDWSQNAAAQERADAVAMLSEVYLHGDLGREDRRDAEAALTMALEDMSPLVRRALAEALGGSDRAPRHIISALAHEQADIATIVLANAPMLSDAELAEHAAFGSALHQRAVASRPYVTAALAAVLSESCDATTAMTLLDNPGAELADDSLRLLVSRHGEDGAFREAVLGHGGLSPDMQMMLAEAAARQLSRFALQRGWMPQARADRICREATECAAITVAQDAGGDDVHLLAVRLRKSGHMTAQLLMRAVLSGEIRLFAAALADLAEVEPARANGFVMGRSMMGFGALYRKAGLPKALEPAFAAAVAGWQELSRNMNVTEGRLSRIMIELVLSGIALLDGPEVERLRALLMTFQAEAARDEARHRISDILAVDALPFSANASAVQAIAAGVVTSDVVPGDDDLTLRLEDALADELRIAA